jgi:uncharacterized protein
MDLATLEAAARKIFGASLPAGELSVVWHAGEPMAVPRGWYEQAFAILARLCPDDVRLTHHFQTNGVLIDARWCEFIKAHDVRIGVSLDGPAWLHDRHRRTRAGGGTHTKVMSGVDALRGAQIPFNVICVLTRESLSHADEIFDFFLAVRPACLCFNVEEVEAQNARSSLRRCGQCERRNRVPRVHAQSRRESQNCARRYAGAGNRHGVGGAARSALRHAHGEQPE